VKWPNVEWWTGPASGAVLMIWTWRVQGGGGFPDDSSGDGVVVAESERWGDGDSPEPRKSEREGAMVVPCGFGESASWGLDVVSPAEIVMGAFGLRCGGVGLWYRLLESWRSKRGRVVREGRTDLEVVSPVVGWSGRPKADWPGAGEWDSTMKMGWWAAVGGGRCVGELPAGCTAHGGASSRRVTTMGAAEPEARRRAGRGGDRWCRRCGSDIAALHRLNVDVVGAFGDVLEFEGVVGGRRPGRGCWVAAEVELVAGEEGDGGIAVFLPFGPEKTDREQRILLVIRGGFTRDFGLARRTVRRGGERCDSSGDTLLLVVGLDHGWPAMFVR